MNHVPPRLIALNGDLALQLLSRHVNRLYAEDANLRPQPWPYSMYSTTLPVVIAYRRP